MKLIVGLGNPGNEYVNTRHNAGFLVIDRICDRLNLSLNKVKFKGEYYQGTINNEKVILLKPQTYMNLSGECVSQFVKYFDIAHEDILVIFDDMDTDVGKIRLRASGSAGGQNGMKNIIDHLGSKDIARLRVGIGKKTIPDVKKYVLSRFKDDEIPVFNEVLDNASDACLYFLNHSIDKVMNIYNIK